MLIACTVIKSKIHDTNTKGELREGHFLYFHFVTTHGTLTSFRAKPQEPELFYVSLPGYFLEKIDKLNSSFKIISSSCVVLFIYFIAVDLSLACNH